MAKRSLVVGCAVVALALAVPSIASGNARRDRGSLKANQSAETPFVARLAGESEWPTKGDPDGEGAASISFVHLTSPNTEVCYDLSYSGIDRPSAAHLHRGNAGENGPVVIGFSLLGSTSASNCFIVETDLAAEVASNPTAFYVNVHTSEFPGGAIRGQLEGGSEPAGSIHVLPVALRSYDSTASPDGKLAGSASRTISLVHGTDLTGARFVAVPPGATAAIVSLTVTQTEVDETNAGGLLKLFKAGSPQPATTAISWSSADQSITVTTTVGVDALGRVEVVAGSTATHFTVDVIGYLY